MSETTRKILGDLPALRQVANRPLAENPLLPVVLAQARALAEISGWAQAAEQLAAGEPVDEPPVVGEATDDGPVPMAAGRAKRA